MIAGTTSFKKATGADERRRTSAKCSRLIYVATNIEAVSEISKKKRGNRFCIIP